MSYLQVSFTGNPDAKKPIQCMATSGHGVWIACQQSAKVSLFHAMSHQLLTQVNVAQIVAQKLQSISFFIAFIHIKNVIIYCIFLKRVKKCVRACVNMCMYKV